MSAAIPPRPDLLEAVGAGEGPPKASWRWWEAIGFYLLAFVAAGVVSAPFVVNRTTEGSGLGGVEIAVTILGDVVITGILLLWLRFRHPRWRESVRFPTRARLVPEAGWGSLAGLALYPSIILVVGLLLTLVFRDLFGDDVEAPEQLASHLSGGAKTLAVLLAVAVAPMAEEFFFRGILFRSLRDRHGFWIGALGSAAAFGLVHYVPSPWKDALLLQSIMFFTGLGLAAIYEWRGNLVANVAAHATFNLIGIVLILAAR